MGNSISIGAAYKDQDLDGSTITNATITGSTFQGAVGGTTPAAGAFTTLNASGATTLDGTVAIGNAAADTVAFYGATKVAQRAYTSAVHATAAASVSASFGASQLAILQEVMNTITGLGIWATS